MLNLAAFKSCLPDSAYDLRAFNQWCAQWTTPNAYSATGGHIERGFSALAFAQDLKAALPALAGFEIEADTMGNDAAPTLRSDSVRLSNGAARIWIKTQAWGARAFEKIEISAWALTAKRGETSRSIEIKVSMTRPIAEIAKDVARRILPALGDAMEELQQRVADKLAKEKVITDKAAQLAKRYPSLKIRADVEAHRVLISTKYGAGVHLDAYSYLTAGKWCLSSQGYGVGLSDIDSKIGRAFLSVANHE